MFRPQPKPKSKSEEYGSFFTNEAVSRDHTLRAVLTKDINDYANNLPFVVKLFGQSNKEKEKIAAYARHLSSISEIDLAGVVLSHIQNPEKRPLPMSEAFCSKLRDSLCHYFNISHSDIIKSAPNLYKSSIAASSYANTGHLAEQNYYQATERLLVQRINNRELRTREELGNVPMHVRGGSKS